nr:MAG TPA: hypothetical protein [Caudoviricetes sp.]
MIFKVILAICGHSLGILHKLQFVFSDEVIMGLR